MRFFLSHPPIGAVATAILVVACFALCPERLQATCGDHLVVQGTAEAQLVPESKLPPQPCHGPNCSQAPQLPASPVSLPSIEPTESQQMLTVSFIPQPDSPDSARLVFDSRNEQPTILVSGIFHPPRLL